MCKGSYIILLGQCGKCRSVLQYRQHGPIQHFHCWKCNKPFGKARWKSKHPLYGLQTMIDRELQCWECANDFHNAGSTPLLNSIRKGPKYVYGTDYLFQMGGWAGALDVACNYGNVPAIIVCL